MQIANYKPFTLLRSLLTKLLCIFLHVTRVRVNLLMNSFYTWVILKDLASRQSRL